MKKLQSPDFNAPAILLGGPVDYDMYKTFRAQLDSIKKEGLIVTELSTLGGDPEVARMMGEDIRFHSENSEGCRFVFLGKAAIYSAGTTFMSFFSIENRYLTRGTRLMIHERKLDKTPAHQRPADDLRGHRDRDAARDRGLHCNPERRVREPDPGVESDDGRGPRPRARQLVYRGE